MSRRTCQFRHLIQKDLSHTASVIRASIPRDVHGTILMRHDKAERLARAIHNKGVQHNFTHYRD